MELIRRGLEHVARTGELSREEFHPDLIWDTTTFGIGFNLKKCIGIDEANTWLAEWTEGFESWSLEIEEVFDAGDQVVTFVRQHAKAKQGGPEVDNEALEAAALRD